MRFEHLIEVNDLTNPMLDEVSRAQLWQGLCLRVEQPALFIPHLDACDITSRSDTGLTRRLRFGELLVEDSVHLHASHLIRIEVPAQQEIPASMMSMQIEEPAAGRLFVRFIYQDANDAATDAANKMYDDFRRSAYLEADLEAVRLIRDLAADGRLG